MSKRKQSFQPLPSPCAAPSPSDVQSTASAANHGHASEKVAKLGQFFPQRKSLRSTAGSYKAKSMLSPTLSKHISSPPNLPPNLPLNLPHNLPLNLPPTSPPTGYHRHDPAQLSFPTKFSFSHPPASTRVKPLKDLRDLEHDSVERPTESPNFLVDITALTKANPILAQKHGFLTRLTQRILHQASTLASLNQSASFPTITTQDFLFKPELFNAICVIAAGLVLNFITNQEYLAASGSLETLVGAKATAFDTALSIELVIRSEQLLDQQSLEFLKDWERHLLSFSVWQSEDPLYTLLRSDKERSRLYACPMSPSTNSLLTLHSL